MKPFLNNATILITGASSGMGLELSRQLAAEAKKLILLARRANKLNTVAKELKKKYPGLSVHTISCDIADSTILKICCEDIKKENGQVDVLINAAGNGHINFFEDSAIDEIERMIQVNVNGLTYLTHQFLPSMIQRGYGGILNYSSFFGLKTLPAFAAYTGSKHYVTGFTETLRAEVSGTGVVVSGVYPGPVKSAFWDIPNAEQMGPPSFLFISIKHCVHETLKGFRKGKASIIPGLRMRLFLTFLKFTPTSIERLINAVMARNLRRKMKTLNKIINPGLSVNKSRCKAI